LQNLYAAAVPALRFEPTPTPQGGWLTQLLRRTWRPAVAVAASAVAVAAVLVGPSLWSGESQVNAETIFARTSAAAQSNAPAAGPQSYHLIASTESGGQSEPTTTEVWYADSSHLRTENEYTGDGSPDFGISVNGADAWMYGDFDGTFRAVHGPASEIGGSFAIQPGGGSDLGEVLSQYNGGCQKAVQDGEETIAGRTAYRIVVSPDITTCPGITSESDMEQKFGTLIIDVDKETFLPLKTEQEFGDGRPAYTYTVTQIEVGQAISDVTFVYTAPAGVTVVDVADQTQAKNILSGYSIDGVPPGQPTTSPGDEPSLDLKTPAP
jgi:outer membrane lipoprotein-sorting protein